MQVSSCFLALDTVMLLLISCDLEVALQAGLSVMWDGMLLAMVPRLEIILDQVNLTKIYSFPPSILFRNIRLSLAGADPGGGGRGYFRF